MLEIAYFISFFFDSVPCISIKFCKTWESRGGYEERGWRGTASRQSWKRRNSTIMNWINCAKEKGIETLVPPLAYQQYSYFTKHNLEDRSMVAWGRNWEKGYLMNCRKYTKLFKTRAAGRTCNTILLYIKSNSILQPTGWVKLYMEPQWLARCIEIFQRRICKSGEQVDENCRPYCSSTMPGHMKPCFFKYSIC